MAAAEASFNISTDSISFGLMSAKGLVGSLVGSDTLVLVTGNPSTTYKGWLLADMDEVPRILTLIPWPTLPLPDSTTTPAALPCMADSKLGAGKLRISFEFTLAIEPVISFFIAWP